MKSQPADVAGLGAADLQRSGLTLEDAAALGMTVHASAKGLHPSLKPLTCLRIPYYHPRTKKALLPWPGFPAFWRVRYLQDMPSSFGEKAKAQKYGQEPGSGACAYFPRTIDWAPILDDPEVPLIITEGEKKAAKACKEGYPAVGLGGVYSFRSASMGLTFLDELHDIAWAKRRAYVVYDSDANKNPQVCDALNDLAEELKSRGALPFVVPMMEITKGEKAGLDDFLVAYPPETLSDLLTDRAQPMTLSQELWRLNEEVVYVRDPGLIIQRASGKRLSVRNFIDHAYSHRQAAERVVKPDGRVSLEPVAASTAWVRWPLRAELDQVTYAPGHPREVEGMWNSWPGWGCEPATDHVDATPFEELVGYVFDGADPKSKDWFLCWLAYPLQFPGYKLFTSAMVHGVKQGTGKSMVGYTMAEVYGKNFVEIKQADLGANHNEWAEDRQFVLADDITGGMKRQDADLLKKLVTQQSIRINPKYIPSYSVPDCINYYFTSNQPDAFFLEDDDRRFFVHEVTGPPIPMEFYREYKAWLASGGASHVFAYLMAYDLEGFDPAAPALRTRAKELMTQDAKSDLGSWVSSLKRDPEGVLRLGDAPVTGDLFTSKQLLDLYDPMGRTGTTANGLTRELRRAGFQMIRGGIPLQTSDGQHRYYAVRDQARWAGCQLPDAQAHVEAMIKERKRR